MEIEDRAGPHPRQFVLLKHVMPALASRPTHWDLMIDFGEKLLTFELHELPPVASGVLRATRLADHRRDYLVYQGPLAPGANGEQRGSVQRISAGWVEYRALTSTATLYCQLTAPELRAEFEYAPCGVAEATQLAIRRWQWLAD